MMMDIKFEIEQQGAIRVSSAIFLHLTETSFVLSLECFEKRPDFDASGINDEGVLTIMLSVDEEHTLHILEGAPRDEEDEFEVTFMEVSGFTGEWYVVAEWGKWGPRICGVKKRGERDESWPCYQCTLDDEEEDTEG